MCEKFWNWLNWLEIFLSSFILSYPWGLLYSIVFFARQLQTGRCFQPGNCPGLQLTYSLYFMKNQYIICILLNPYGIFSCTLHFSKNKREVFLGHMLFLKPLREASKRTMIYPTCCIFFLLLQKLRKYFIKQRRVLVSIQRCRELERELLSSLQWKKWTDSKFTTFLEPVEVLRLLGNQQTHNLGRDRYLQGETRHEHWLTWAKSS